MTHFMLAIGILSLLGIIAFGILAVISFADGEALVGLCAVALGFIMLAGVIFGIGGYEDNKRVEKEQKAQECLEEGGVPDIDDDTVYCHKLEDK